MAETMTAFLTAIGSFFTQVITWMGELIEVISSNPALTIVTFGFLIVGSVFGYLSRLIRGN